MTTMQSFTRKTVLALCVTGVCTLASAKLPAPSPEAAAKAAEAAAKAAWAGKVDNYKLCLSQDKVAAHYRKTTPSAKPAAATGAACTGPWSLRLYTASGQACRGCWCTLATWHSQQPSQHAGTCRCSCTGLQVLTRALPRRARSRVPWWGAAFFLGAMCQVHRRASTRRAIRHQPAPLVQWTGPRSGSFPCANRGSTTLRIFAP